MQRITEDVMCGENEAGLGRTLKGWKLGLHNVGRDWWRDVVRSEAWH